MVMEFVEAATKNATGERFASLASHLDMQITVAVLGQTLTSGQTQGGSEPRGTVVFSRFVHFSLTPDNQKLIT
jgi:phage gp29-like protein